MRKPPWSLVTVGIVAASGFLLGSVVTERVLVTPQSTPLVESAAATPPRSREGIGDDVVRRNVFCSRCPAADAAGEPALEAELDPPPASPIALRLVAVNLAIAPWCAHSSVVLRDTERQLTGGFRVRDRVRGATIVAITPTRVLLDRQGRSEILDLLVRDRPQSPTDGLATQMPRDPFNEAVAHGIKAIGPHSRTIDRATLTMALANMGQVSGSARIAPELRDGHVAGLRFYSVTPGGAFAQLGFRSGDRLISINGLELSDPLGVYQRLQTASHLTIDIQRDGRQLAEEYDIR
jgi:type II secretion system protein C